VPPTPATGNRSRLDAPLWTARGAARDGLPRLIIADYLAVCGETSESPRRLALMFLPRLLHNPSLQATVMIRLAHRSPRFMFGIWRTLLIAKHSIDVEEPIEIGPGLVLPHPFGIVLGRGTRIGSNVRILNTVTIGARPGRDWTPAMCPQIGDGVTIWTQSIVVGPIIVGPNAVLGARSWIDKDVAAGEVVRGRGDREP
jgi:serine O-acetyltransferase